MINFDYDLDETVQMDGRAVSLRTALTKMPACVGPYGVLHREAGKAPAFFDAAQIQALLALQLRFCFEVSALSGSLVSPSPE